MEKEDLIKKLVDDIYSIEEENEISSLLKDTKVTDFQKSEEERKNDINERIKAKKKPIENVVSGLAEQFDLSNPKTYVGIRELALMQLISRELYRKAMADLRDEKKKKGANSTIYSEYRKTTEFILKLIKDVYIAPESKEIKVPDRDLLFKSDKYIKLE
jgi:hypothetical protein